MLYKETKRIGHILANTSCAGNTINEMVITGPTHSKIMKQLTTCLIRKHTCDDSKIVLSQLLLSSSPFPESIE